MSKRFLCMFLALVMLLGILSGCGNTAPQEDSETETVTTAPETEPTVPATIPADGDPDDVTCKGSYTADSADGAIVARTAHEELTNATLQVFYRMEVEAWQEAEQAESPDFSRPLDTQSCPIDDSVNSWQQYFLKRALNTWHTVQALAIQAEEQGVPTEEAYQPNEKNHKEYLTDKPATKWLYGYNKSYSPNELHQAYLEEIPQLLEQLASEKGFSDAAAMAKESMSVTRTELEEAVKLYNFGYMYFTTLGYDLEPTAEEVEAQSVAADTGKLVNIRHILLTDEAAVTTETLLQEYQEKLKDNSYAALKTTEEAIFAELANEFSEDAGTRNDGGSYRDIRQGQLISQLDSWCFDPARQYGDITTIQTEYGYHILFFASSRETGYAAAEAAAISEMETGLITAAREAYPMDVNYSGILLVETAGTQGISASEVLYPDIAHERFPVVPLYLQQDYPTTKYGAYNITSHGCGITTLAMLASYMADDDMTPPRMCEAYDNYVYKTGTDGALFVNAPAEMGFYLRQRTYEFRDAYAALEEGYIVVVVQHKGFWTRGGHYLVLEKLNEDGRVQVRDSNIYNYGRLHDHKIDSFEWSTVTPKGMCYWIYEPKVVAIPACSRCGEEGASEVLTADYLCEKCTPALIRRNTWLTAAGVETAK